VLQQIRNMSAPPIQGLFAFCQKLMALVHGGYAGDRPPLMVEYLVGNMRGDAKPRHARNTGASQIMEPPACDLGEFVEFASPTAV
jgi:hypothetical protein